MKAISIDPFAHIVIQIDLISESPEVDALARIGAENYVAYPLDGFSLSDEGFHASTDMLLMDSEAFNRCNHLFRIAGFDKPCAGRCIIVGNKTGEAYDGDDFADAEITLDMLENKITWLD